MDDPEDAAIIRAVVAAEVADGVRELRADFGQRHEYLAQSAKETRGEVTELRATVSGLTATVTGLVDVVAGLSARLAEIEEPTRYAMQLGMALGAENGTTGPLPPEDLPVPGTRRPAAVDRACAVAGTRDARPAIIPQYGNLVIHPKQGYSPTQVYDDVIRTIEDVRSTSSEGGASETTGLRRARRARKH